MKTYSKKASEVNRGWTLIDASEAPLGRISTIIANRLMGKYKPTYTPNIDDGDYVVVINADKLVVTGNKEIAKNYYNYSGFPGGMKTTKLADVRKSDASKLVVAAVKGMLPKNKLAADRLTRLRVFNGTEHGHGAQKPVKVEVK